MAGSEMSFQLIEFIAQKRPSVQSPNREWYQLLAGSEAVFLLRIGEQKSAPGSGLHGLFVAKRKKIWWNHHYSASFHVCCRILNVHWLAIFLTYPNVQLSKENHNMCAYFQLQK